MMEHPVVLKCAARTAECSRKVSRTVQSPRPWDSQLAELLSSSREAIAHSRQLLSHMTERGRQNERTP